MEKSLPSLEMEFDALKHRRQFMERPTLTIPYSLLIAGILLLLMGQFLAGGAALGLGVIASVGVGFSQAKHDKLASAIDQELTNLRGQIVAAREKLD